MARISGFAGRRLPFRLPCYVERTGDRRARLAARLVRRKHIDTIRLDLMPQLYRARGKMQMFFLHGGVFRCIVWVYVEG